MPGSPLCRDGAGPAAAQPARAFPANGNRGQFTLGLPALDKVIVHRRALPDEFAVARDLGDTDVDQPGVSAETSLAIADKLLEARIRSG